jgi:hypothetical protein
VRPERARRRCVHDRRVIKIGIRIVRLSDIIITDLRSVAERVCQVNGSVALSVVTFR